MASSRERRKAFFGARTTVSAPPPPLSREEENFGEPSSTSNGELRELAVLLFKRRNDWRGEEFFFQP